MLRGTVLGVLSQTGLEWIRSNPPPTIWCVHHSTTTARCCSCPARSASTSPVLRAPLAGQAATPDCGLATHHPAPRGGSERQRQRHQTHSTHSPHTALRPSPRPRARKNQSWPLPVKAHFQMSARPAHAHQRTAGQLTHHTHGRHLEKPAPRAKRAHDGQWPSRTHERSVHLARPISVPVEAGAHPAAGTGAAGPGPPGLRSPPSTCRPPGGVMAVKPG